MRTSETTDWNVLLGCDNTLQAVADITFIDGEKGILRYRGYDVV